MDNKDLKPIESHERTWGKRNYFTFWVTLSFCIPSYMLASSLIASGMNWYQALITIFLGNAIILIPMLINGHAGAKYGITFPVLARASYGVLGANLPAFFRAIVACGWFGILSWIGGTAIEELLFLWIPGAKSIGWLSGSFLGVSRSALIAFLFFMSLQIWSVSRGAEFVKKMLFVLAFLLPISIIGLVSWAIYAGGGIFSLLNVSQQMSSGHHFWTLFVPGLTGMIGFWSTLALNIPDFTRYARSQSSHIIGQSFSLPFSMVLLGFSSILITSASVLVFHQALWNPVELIHQFKNPVVITVAMGLILASTFSTNMAANLVSPANDFTHMFPKHLTFAKSAILTGIVSILMCPWALISDPHGYIYIWLMAVSSLLGAVGGVMICEYVIIKRGNLTQSQISYLENRRYHSSAMKATILGIIPCLPGFIFQIRTGVIGQEWYFKIYEFAWFVSFLIAMVTYFLLVSLGESKTIKG